MKKDFEINKENSLEKFYCELYIVFLDEKLKDEREIIKRLFGVFINVIEAYLRIKGSKLLEWAFKEPLMDPKTG